jgi:ketosteroid isomerase-like protein
MSRNRITILHDSFGKRSDLTKEWGFAALVEYGGKRILFDTGNSARTFAKNTEAIGVDLRNLEAVFEFLYRFPGWPNRIEGRAAYMKVMEGYSMDLHSADGLVVHLTRDPRVVVLEYEVHGTAPSTGKPYDNRFCSIVTIEDRKIVRWRDYMDSLAPMLATSNS